MYSFVDGYSNYNQVQMAYVDQPKTAFITAWGVFACTVMWFGLQNAPGTFQRDMQQIFGPYLTDFMRIFLDDFSTLGIKITICSISGCVLSLNPLKCVFAVSNGMLLGQIISKDGIAAD